MSLPVVELSDLCPRCHNASLVEVRDQAMVMKSVEEDGKIVRQETDKEVLVRVCSNAACGYRSDDA
jgi:hypothetical protein